jgi:cytochrome P450
MSAVCPVTLPVVIELVAYEDVVEAWKRAELSSGLTGPGEEHFHQGTVMRLDGEAHALRRKTLGALLSRRGHQHFREQWLYPAVKAALAKVLKAPGDDGFARVDLLRWARRVNQQLAAALTGLDGATTVEGAAHLFDLMELVLRGRPGAYQVVLGGYDPNTPTALAALDARQRIMDTFYAPALLRRRHMLEVGSELPHDLLSLIARAADPAWMDPKMAERDAMFLLAAAVHTTSSTFIWVLRELFAWLNTNPKERHRIASDSFIYQAVQETLRLHPVVPGFPRLATQDVELKSGKQIPKGAIAILRSGPAGVATQIYGQDAKDFRPGRAIPSGATPFGLAFGMGTHMCFGMPIVLGSGGVDGSLVYLLRSVLSAGVVPDEDDASFNLTATRGVFSTGAPDDSYVVKFKPDPLSTG